MNPSDGAALIKCTKTVSSCVNVLTQFNYVGDLNSEVVLGSATRKWTVDMKTKWLTYVKQDNLYEPEPLCSGRGSMIEHMFKTTCFYLQTLRGIVQSQATKKRPKAARLQHQLQTQRVIIRRPSKCVRWKTANIRYGNVRKSRRRMLKREDKRRKNWNCASNICQTHIRWKCALADFATLMVAENLMTDCYTDHTEKWNGGKMLQMSRRSLTCPNEKQWCASSYSTNNRECKQNSKNVRVVQLWS